MLQDTIWKVQTKKSPLNLTIPELFDILLQNRNITTDEDINNFLTPSLSGITEMVFSDMEKTILRIEKAIKNKEKISVYSDYDADGISAAAILWETLKSLGADVMPYIPDRIREGYGFSKAGIKSVSDTGVSLIISVDHGVTAVEEIEYAKSLGIDVILTDHHIIPDKSPKPYSLIHTTLICGAAVSWKLSYELHKYFNLPLENIYEKLAIASIATIADQMPLVSHNRAIVKHGLEYLKATKRPGLVELFSVSSINRSKIDEYHLGHIIAPRINAMGRLDNAIQSLRLYCTNSPQKARDLSKILEETNIRRQNLTTTGVTDAFKLVDENKKIIILDSLNWHEGIIGLIAGRINDKFNKPTIIISKGKLFSKGSARSVAGVDITDLLRSSSQDLLEDVGGHTMAAGFTVKTENIGKLKKSINEHFEKKYLNQKFYKEVLVETELLSHHVNLDLYNQIQKLRPFGNSNNEPIFLLKNQLVKKISKVGSDQSHIKIDLENISCIGFRLAEKSSSIRYGDYIDIIFTLNLNEFNGRSSLQLVLIDLAKTGDKNIQRARTKI